MWHNFVCKTVRVKLICSWVCLVCTVHRTCSTHQCAAEWHKNQFSTQRKGLMMQLHVFAAHLWLKKNWHQFLQELSSEVKNRIFGLQPNVSFVEAMMTATHSCQMDLWTDSVDGFHKILPLGAHDKIYCYVASVWKKQK